VSGGVVKDGSSQNCTIAQSRRLAMVLGLLLTGTHFHMLQGPWKGRVPADCSVVLEVDIASIKSGQRVSLTDSGDSAVDSRYIHSCCGVACDQ
jgi:hypothetical protein